MSLVEAAPENPPVELFKKPRRKSGPSKSDKIRSFATVVHDEEMGRGQHYIQEFMQRPVFNLQQVMQQWISSEFPASLEAMYTQWQKHRDAGFPKEDLDPLELVRISWEAAQTDPAFLENMGEFPEDIRYYIWLFDEPDVQAIQARIPEGWPEWTVGGSLGSQAAMKTRVSRGKKDSDAAVAALAKPKKEPKPKKVKEAMDLRSVFLRRLEAITVESLQRPWMAQRSLRLVTTEEDLQAWADRVISDKSLYRACPVTGEMMPAIALDTETFGANGGKSGLDVRLVLGLPQNDIAGFCLSADGIEGIYVPISHEDGNNCPREAARRILQNLFDQSFLLFFNGKFDREVCRMTMGLKLRPYPYFEDVQILHFLLDPKSDVDEETSSFESAGLKALAERELDIHMIELDELALVKAKSVNPATGKTSQRNHYAPFNWIPTHLAVWYAAADAICTWLLWDKMHEEARTMKFVHKVDHRLEDALAWIERQRPLIDVDQLHNTARWHQEKLQTLGDQLAELSGIPDFNPKSTPQLSRVLFETLGYPVIKRTPKGAPSTDADVLEELVKIRPHPFLDALSRYNDYKALHPSHLRYDPRDNTARMFFKQCTVAGGRLAATGGGKDGADGGFGLNPQAIVSVDPRLSHWITVRRLRLEDTEDLGEGFVPGDVPSLTLGELHSSCIKIKKETVTRPNPDYQPPEGGSEAPSIPEFLEVEVGTPTLDVPRVVNNHVARYCGEWWSLASDEESITLPNGTVIRLDPPKDVDANEVVNMRALFLAPPGYTMFVVDYCLVPGSRVLTSDLRWVPVETVSEGDELIGFDETLPEKFCPNRKLRATRVTAREVFSRPCVRITTDRGVVTCSVEHQWLTRVRKGGAWNARGDARGQYGWRESQHLKVGDEIARLCDPWEEEVSPEAGYLAGVFDGEGWVSSQTVGFGQKEGYVLDKVEGLLRVRGYDVRRSTSGSKVTMLRLNGGRQETLRFLGSVRPGRLITNARSKMWEGLSYRSRYTQAAKVLAIEEVGEQEVIALRTTERTFIAEGMLSHNCNIEMRVAANCSREPKFIHEFLEGSGDFHTLTAMTAFPEFSKLKAKVAALKAQDPEGINPEIQAQIKSYQSTMKHLRSLAKVINFALLYGGTEHAIYEGMKAQDPTITKEKAKAMVDRYWDGVPMFKEWAQIQQQRARDTMTCKTASGRKINFKSAMRALKITEPLPEHWTAYRAMWDLKRDAERLKKSDPEASAKLEARATQMYRDKATGVANLGDYKKFMGKIQRVATNAPLQGLAGDFMRTALGHIHSWWEEAGLGDILLVYATVHDEVDFCVRNEYVPYVIPRLIKIMKLRDIHAQMKWPVPIECDCEYGSCWDVKEHLTGDDSHTPAGYTKVPGLENYVPACFDPDTVDALKEAIGSHDTEAKAQAMAYLKEATHPRCHGNIPKLAALHPVKALVALTAILQLHEYWVIDEAPEGTDESLESYQSRMGLSPRVENPETLFVMPPQVAVSTAKEPVVDEGPEEREDPPDVVEEQPQVDESAPLSEPLGNLRPKVVDGRPVLRDLTDSELIELTRRLGVGSKTTPALMNGEPLTFIKVKRTEIPPEYLEMEAVDEES